MGITGKPFNPPANLANQAVKTIPTDEKVQDTSDYVSQSVDASKSVVDHMKVKPTNDDAHDTKPHPSNGVLEISQTVVCTCLHGQSKVICSDTGSPITKHSSSPLSLLGPTILVPKLPHMTMLPVIKLFQTQQPPSGPDPGGTHNIDSIYEVELEKYNTESAVVGEVVPGI